MARSPSPELTNPARQPHAVLDLQSRRLKGLKIERLLSLTNGDRPIRLLEIGTGSGGIAHYFGMHPTLHCDVDAVDVHDSRLITEGYRYCQVTGTDLPFEDATFDVVLTNHVIEHVGGDAAQRSHLAEIQRVLRPAGSLYLALPNRWMLVEPHFKLPLLSWLPQSIADRYVRAFRKGDYYDCRPLTAKHTEKLLIDSGFSFKQHHGNALLLTIRLERPSAHTLIRMIELLPSSVYKRLRRLFPTLIYTATKTAVDNSLSRGDLLP